LLARGKLRGKLESKLFIINAIGCLPYIHSAFTTACET
jgi:hypothetical protein